MAQPSRLTRAINTKKEQDTKFTSVERVAAGCELNLATTEAGEDYPSRTK